MANLAYLYSAERPDAWEHPEEGYNWSRWVIPLAWFFFYRVAEITWIDVTFDGMVSWKEVAASRRRRPRPPRCSPAVGLYSQP